jgi:hypothetical protein
MHIVFLHWAGGGFVAISTNTFIKQYMATKSVHIKD